MTKFLQIFLDASLYLLLIPLLFGSALSLVSHRNKSLVVIYFGFFAQVIGGGIGIIIHELSHLIVALLFRHQIKALPCYAFPVQTTVTLASATSSTPGKPLPYTSAVVTSLSASPP